MVEADEIAVEVAFALPERQRIVALSVPRGCNAREAVERSGIAALFDAGLPEQAKLGIFGRLLDDPDAHVLEAGERVEIYRPLLIEPKAARRRRARAGPASGNGG